MKFVVDKHRIDTIIGFGTTRPLGALDLALISPILLWRPAIRSSILTCMSKESPGLKSLRAIQASYTYD